MQDPCQYGSQNDVDFFSPAAIIGEVELGSIIEDLPKGLISAALITVGLPGFALVSLVGVDITIRLGGRGEDPPSRTADPSSYLQPFENQSVEYESPRVRTHTRAKQESSRSTSKTSSERDNTPQLIEGELSAARYAEQEARDFHSKAEKAYTCYQNMSQRSSNIEWKLEHKKHWKKVREKKLEKKQSKATQCFNEANRYMQLAQEAEVRAAKHRQNASMLQHR